MNAGLGPIILAFLVAAQAAGQSFRLPPPPQQHAPWTSPANVPTNLLSALTTLFEQGFPDPRGCEYREIEVTVSGLWGAGESLWRGGGAEPERKPLARATRGWVLPETSDQTQRFAICWNGLIYPTTNIGPAVDLHAEATNLLVANGRRFNAAVGETVSVFASNALSTRVLLLLHAGETEAALKSWSPDSRFPTKLRSGQPATNAADPYLQLASDWAWSLFDRTICTHMRGDASLALATARTLAEVHPKIEAEAARRGFPRPQRFDSRRDKKEQPYLDFLEQLPALVADLERREREGHRDSVLTSGLTNGLNSTQRIAALIRDLEFVEAWQWSQPGSLDLAGDPIVAALIRAGDPAVELLLDCLEADQRLTLSVGFFRDFSRSRRVIPVASAARTALGAILQANLDSAAEIRAYWAKYKDLKIEDRWYVILQDDAAGMGRWLEVANNVTQPNNLLPGTGTGFSTTKPSPTNPPVRLRGEILRGKSNPSITELLSRRALEIIPTNIAGYDLATACELGLRLAVWDLQSASPVAKALGERQRVLIEYSDPRHTRREERLGGYVAQLAEVRAQAGDPEAFEHYAAWLQTTTPEQMQHYLGDCLMPLRRFPTNATLQALADTLFHPDNLAWGRLPWKGAGSFNPVESELVNVPAFRRLLVRELDLKAICGSIEWHGPGMISYQLTNSGSISGSRGLSLPEPERPTNGTKAQMRWCDWIASMLANAKKIPPFNPFASVEKRDEAIQAAKTALARP
ncbi:MAG: hypothetical protein V9H26_03630 [Verrucomicrobiota bacterium]